MLEGLLDKRLVLFAGKGGVGRSTCALGFAQAAAGRGKRVLLCEMAARPASTEFLGVPAAGHVPTRPIPERHPTLWTACLDPQRSLEEYLTEQLKSRALVRIAVRNRVLARLWDAAPSVSEMALLTAVHRYETATERGGTRRFDMVVVDLPATGHALAMLGVPRGAISMIRVGALAKRAQEIDDLLRDQSKTAVCVVTLAEELPVNESVELFTALRERLGICAEHVVVNGLLREAFSTDAERRTFYALTAGDLPVEARRAVEVAHRAELRRQLQRLRLGELEQRLDHKVITIGKVHHTALRGAARIAAVAGALLPARSPG